MNENEQATRDELVAWVMQDEPHFHPEPGEVRKKASRIRRARWAGSGMLALVVVAGSALVVSQLRDSSAETASTPQVAAASPADYASNISRLAGGLTTPFDSSATDAVRAFDGRGNAIDAKDRDKASTWQGQFLSGPGHVIDISVGHVTDAPKDGRLDTLKRECEYDQSTAPDVTVCDVTESADGDAVKYIEKDAYSYDRGWVTPFEDAMWDGVPLWRVHQVYALTSNGMSILVTEAQLREGAAESGWMKSDELIAIATDDSLYFKPAPRNDDGCRWTVASGVGDEACSK